MSAFVIRPYPWPNGPSFLSPAQSGWVSSPENVCGLKGRHLVNLGQASDFAFGSFIYYFYGLI
jgi:hypothetical protein